MFICEKVYSLLSRAKKPGRQTQTVKRRGVQAWEENKEAERTYNVDRMKAAATRRVR